MAVVCILETKRLRDCIVRFYGYKPLFLAYFLCLSYSTEYEAGYHRYMAEKT